jgi:excisionase family DNA binding protein
MKGEMMAKKSELLTSGEFAVRAGIPAATVSKLIRDGKIKAYKTAGRWMISPSQLKAVQEISKSEKPSPKKKPLKPIQKKTSAPVEKPPAPEARAPAATPKSYTVAEFAAMTYLTEFGVKEWLKKGMLTGRQDESGTWQIDAANLEVPNVKRLVRLDKIA